MRYVVTEIEGYIVPRTAGNSKPGLSCHVLDTAFNRKLVFTARTEGLNSQARSEPTDWQTLTHEQRRSHVREAAATRCDLLNRLDEIAREAQGAVA